MIYLSSNCFNGFIQCNKEEFEAIVARIPEHLEWEHLTCDEQTRILKEIDSTFEPIKTFD